MRKLSKRLLFVSLAVSVCLMIPWGIWLLLTHQPTFYRAMVRVPHEQQEVKARRFAQQSLQLQNDINNEPTWEAVFTDNEVNAWLAEELVTHFRDQLPPGVHEPRVVFELDRVILAFQLDQGPVSSVIWVVARPRVPQENVLELSLEKIRAGVLPIPAEKLLGGITDHARGHGLNIEWKHEEGVPVAVLRYRPHQGRDDVVLEKLQIREGQIRLAGRSNRTRGVVGAPTLPTRKVLQSRFPRRRAHEKGVSIAPRPTQRSSAIPTS